MDAPRCPHCDSKHTRRSIGLAGTDWYCTSCRRTWATSAVLTSAQACDLRDRIDRDLIAFHTLLRSMHDFLPGAKQNEVLAETRAHVEETLALLGMPTQHDREKRFGELTGQEYMAPEQNGPQDSRQP